MKKKVLLTALILVLVLGVFSACGADPGVISAPTAQPAATDAPSSGSVTEAQTEAPVSIGTLDDYVVTAKEVTQSFYDGNVKTFRLPRIVLEGDDALAANTEIMERFGDDCKEYEDYSPVISMDYEAYLNDNILSVMVTGRYDGGNSYGLCYNFDVTTGYGLNNLSLCSEANRDYNNAVSTLRTNLTSYYDEKYSALSGNDEMRTKTLADENIESAVLYIGSDGKLVAMTDIYAAVGGGHWVDTISAE